MDLPRASPAGAIGTRTRKFVAPRGARSMGGRASVKVWWKHKLRNSSPVAILRVEWSDARNKPKSNACFTQESGYLIRKQFDVHIFWKVICETVIN